METLGSDGGHSRTEPPIVHLDIKPSNILVQHRHSDDIHVKLGDFGLSREGPDPTTICGSERYLAPEVYNEKDREVAHYDKRRYTLAVDIWSLGVTILECAYDHPSCKAIGVLWCEEIVKKLGRDFECNPDDLKRFLWDTMVILQPKLRGTAQYCYDQVLPLLIWPTVSVTSWGPFFAARRETCSPRISLTPRVFFRRCGKDYSASWTSIHPT